MDLVIFAVGFVVTMSAVYGVFAQVPKQMVLKEDSPTDPVRAAGLPEVSTDLRDTGE